MTKKALALLILCTFLLWPWPGLAQQSGPHVAGSLTRAIEEAMLGQCPRNPLPVSPDRVDELLQNLGSEELSYGQAMQLTRLANNFECGLNEEARPAAIALKTESATRRLDPIAVLEREVDLVTPELLPESWNSLLEAAGHVPDSDAETKEKVAPIILGCVAAMGYVGNSWSCSNDGFDQHDDCVNNRLCAEGQAVDTQCCDDKLDSDLNNCYLSGGTNTPDGDYANCC